VRGLFRLLIVALGWTGSASAATPTPATAPALSRPKGAGFVVVHPAKPLPVEKTAAEELAAYLAQSAGLQTRVLGEDNLTAPDAADAYVGACAYTKSAGLYRDTLDQEGFVVKTHGGKLVIYGDDGPGKPFAASTRTGTMFGVYDLVERDLGVEWIWPGPTGEVVPRREGLRLPHLDRYEKPDFLIRAMVFHYARFETKEMNEQTAVWAKRLKMGRVPKAWFGHSWSNYVFGKGKDKEHPEWLALWSGERRGPHLCTSNQDVRDWIVECVLEDAKTKGNTIVSISPSDGYGFCECEKCRALDPPGTDYSQAIPNLSNRHWDYANYVAKEVKKRDPKLGVAMLAYTAYSSPPTHLDTFEDNVYVSLTFSAAYCVKPERKKAIYDNIDGWKTKGVKLVGYEYWGMHYWLDLPYLFTAEIADLMPRLHDRGMVALHGEAGKNFGNQGPNYFLAAHLMWDAEDNATAILDRFYRAFGPAEEPIRRYYQALEALPKAHEAKIADFGYRDLINAWGEILPLADVEKAGRHLAQAKKLAQGDPSLQERIHVVEIGYDYARIMLELVSLYKQLGRAGVPLWFFGYEGDVEQMTFYKQPPDAFTRLKEIWKDVPRVELSRDEKLRLLRRAKELGEAREKIIRESADLPAVSVGLYQYTVEKGVHPWHPTIVKELEKMEQAK